jgi:PAS domain S-box-containing protein
VFENQGLLGIAFFEATAFIILLVLFLLLRRDNASSYFRLWLVGWSCLTISALCELGLLFREAPGLRLATLGGHMAALLLFLGAAIQYAAGANRRPWSIMPLAGATLLGVCYVEGSTAAGFGHMRWETAILESVVCLWAGWLLWRVTEPYRGHGLRLLAGAFLISGLHGMDRPLWPEHPLFVFRIAFDHLLGVTLGVGMIVLVLESARSRTEDMHEKMRQLTLLTAATTQSLAVQGLLDKVLAQLVDSLGATHGLIRLIEGEGNGAQLVLRASVGFSPAFQAQHRIMPLSEPWTQKILKEDCQFLKFEDETNPEVRQRMAETGVTQLVTLALRGKEGPLGIITVGSNQSVRFQSDEIAYLVNIANFLGMTLQNVRLFEQITTVQQQWAYTFDSIGDPILVHDHEGRILRTNLRLCHLLGREATAVMGRAVTELLFRREVSYRTCPYCEGLAGEGDEPDPWLQGYFLASNSTFADPSGRQLGTVHVLKDITERKRAEEKYRTLVASVQEGVFISTPPGRFLDFNDAMLRITGYERREELLGADIPRMYVNPADRERLKRLLQEHGAVSDFEFEIRRKDGEVRTVMESSIAVRDAEGGVTAYQGFLLDISERKRAEQEIRRRNRELMVLNSIAQVLTESMDLSDSLHRTLRQMAELFSLDASSLYLLDEAGSVLRRVAAVGHRSEYARHFPPASVQPELLQQIRAVHATFLSAQGLPLPAALKDAHRKEEIASAYIVILWSKDRVIGGLVVASRTPREFSPADINLLIAVGSQISSAIQRTLLYEETRQAYENLRRTQEQLLHSEKMAAIGQLISGVAHELNNPLTAILGYSQLLTSSGQIGPQGAEYSEKLYKQAQRTHRIVQNLLSFARQHKPERVPVQINQILEETFALRDYDLRMSNIRVHLDLAATLPGTAADPHQLQQVFLNMVNNAVDAVLDHAKDGDLWIQTGAKDNCIFIEFTDSGPGVQDPTRVFDPFYTTKAVGKGTGLGLSICYGIVTEHGGTIRVRNVPPRGASFLIELPCQVANAVVVLKAPAKAGPGRGGRILVMDDDESVLETVAAILRGREHTVRTTQTARQALTLLEENEFDLVIANVQGPPLQDGTSLRQWIEAKKPDLLQRLLWMGTIAPEGESINEKGFAGFRILQKPFKAVDLLAEVEARLSEIYSASLER